MAFEESLKYAVDHLGGKATAFVQSGDVCLAHSVRWMIDQLMKRPFGAGKTPVDLGWPSKIKLVLDEYTQDEAKQAKLSKVLPTNKATGKEAKADKLYQKLAGIEPRDGRHHTAEATRAHLKEKFSGKVIQVDDSPDDPSLEEGVANIKRLASEGDKVAAMISLRSTGKNGRGAGSKTFNHAMAFFSRKGNVKFFDPNMGEVELPSANFAKWFDEYRNEWKTHKKMTNADSVSVFRVQAPADVKEGYVKSLKMAAFLKLISDGEELDRAAQNLSPRKRRL